MEGQPTVEVQLDASIILSGHLPPAREMTETLLGYLREARHAPSFIGPDQAALERMMAALPPLAAASGR